MKPNPNLLNALFTITIIITFIAGGISLLSSRLALAVLRVAVISLAGIFSWGSISTVWFAIGMANAFNPGSAGYGFFCFYHAVLLAYYIFAVATCFSRVLGLPWIVAMHFVVAPVITILSGFLGHRLAMMLCFVLVWLRIYDLRRQTSAA